ncbi:unnamed protein product [Debaryomyces tyrocola]|nr:unnamed protein product [Debaryomyces tyrocola]
MSAKRSNSEGNDLNKKRSQLLPQMSRISRSISACQRCRVKKIKCDQNFPKCTKCDKADVDCVGLDSVTGREVPRSYVMYLENRIMQLEEKITGGGICPIDNNNEVTEEAEPRHDDDPITNYTEDSKLGILPQVLSQQVPFENIDASIFDGSGISFSKLMFTAIRTHSGGKEKDKINTIMGFENTSALPAILPPKITAQEFLKIFFSQSNPQLPIFHREEFIRKYFIPIYGKLDEDVILGNNYTSINVSLFQGAENIRDEDTWFFQYKQEFQKRLQTTNNTVDPNEISNTIVPPKKFHKALYFLSMAFAISCSVHHLQYHSNISNSFKIAANRYFEIASSSEDKLESLQSILLLTLYSLMRPTVPGVWYVLGLALRVCVDLGLHKEPSIQNSNSIDFFTQDKRRRLFWCTYALDRQICFYLGRPIGIPEESIDTPFPSVLDDSFIGNNNSKDPPLLKSDSPTYKSISLAFFEMRRIQSEVQKVLYEDSDIPRNFSDLHEWKLDIIEKLKNWKLHLPKTERDMNCDFNVEFFNLNYNHTVLMIHGLSPKNNKLSVPDFIRLQDSSKEIIHCYNQLHASKCINYTWVTVHNLFLAGTCYLYAIYSSDDVCKQNGLHEVKIVSRECINVLNSLIDKCAAAYNCRHSFEVLTAAVVKLRYNEIMHGFDSYIPTAQQIAKNQPVGYVNSNLDNLVQNLESRSESEDNSKLIEKHTQMDVVNNFFHFASNTSTKEDEVNNESDTICQSPSTFEWISIDKSSKPSNNNLTDIQNSGNHLNTFFDNLDKLPPLPIEADDYINDNNMTGNSDAEHNHHPIQADNNNYKSQARMKLSESQYQGSSHVHQPKDRKQQFGLPDAPVDSIWDQFLTSVTPAFGLNSSLFMLQDKSENHDKYQL